MLVVLEGTSSTEAYYGYFGLAYQMLEIPPDHLVYRGLTTIFASAIAGSLYLIAIAVILGQSRIALCVGGTGGLKTINYLFVVLFACAGWWAGRYAGETAAQQDATVKSSTLPTITRIVPKEESAITGIEGAAEGIRLLLQTREGLHVFRPVLQPKTEVPLLRYIPKEQFAEVHVCAHC